MTNEEKAQEIIAVSNANMVYDIVDFKSLHEAQKEDLLEMAEWKDKQYSDVIEMLIDELNTSKLYHLGITGLDTDEEAAEKRRKGECSLIRGIERAINYAELVIEKK